MNPARNRFIRRSVTVYIAVFICMALMLTPGYFLFCNILEENAVSTNQVVLAEGLQRFEDTLTNIQLASRMTMRSNKILLLNLLDENLSAKNGYDIREGLETFRNITSQLSMTSHCGFLLKNNSLLFENKYYNNADDFYAQFFLSAEDSSFSEWLDSLKVEDAAFSLSHKTFSALDYGYLDTLVYAEPLPTGANWNSYIFFSFIKLEDVVSLLALPDTLSNARLALSDAAGHDLFTISHIDDTENQIRIQARSAKYGLTTTLDLSRDYVFASLRVYIRYLLIFFAAYLLFGIILFAILIRKNLQPVLGWMNNAESILREIRIDAPADSIQSSDAMNEFMLFVKNKLRENKTLLYQQRDALCVNLFELALRDGMPEKPDAIMRGLFDEFPQKWRMTVIRLLGWNQLLPENGSLVRLYAESVIATLPEVKWRHFSGDMLILILPEACSQERAERIVESIQGDLLINTQIEIQSAISCAREGLGALPEAFAVLRSHLRALETELPAATYIEDRKDCSLPFVNIHTDADLYDTIMRGDSAAVSEKIRAIADKYRHLNRISEMDFMQFFFLCRSALLQAGSDLGLQDFSYPAYNTAQDLQAMCASLSACAVALCESALQRIKDNADSFDQKLLSWIHECLGNSELCVQSVCEQFSISPATLQRVMRRCTGMSFLEYVEAERMKLAKELLIHTGETAKDIAEKCGFSSANSFYKAFKRYFQTSPSAMRNQEASEQDP